ncbi:hypothetical protein R0G64_23405 [Pseudomonas otitidis]|uniref:Uncharacterized protein n=1 Tax=Metapseudomonas otitidis TaxID=319939 RepID=A0ABU3XX90_9GAMM|nr:hypothetical protein [Pseudomonas otitidis]MDV3442359.1 hypothetical protein [Pseudomonas otitidis]WMR35087.1 hypothetical protein QT513_10270 [Pseudomonas otitidis]
MLASLLTGLMTFHKVSEHTAIHRAVAGQFLALRNEACFFREVELLETDRLYELPERLKALSSARNTSSSYAQWVNDEITRAKIIVANVRQYEKDEMPVTAENEIKKLFRF